jgi:hypothetical protein
LGFQKIDIFKIGTSFFIEREVQTEMNSAVSDIKISITKHTKDNIQLYLDQILICVNKRFDYYEDMDIVERFFESEEQDKIDVKLYVEWNKEMNQSKLFKLCTTVSESLGDSYIDNLNLGHLVIHSTFSLNKSVLYTLTYRNNSDVQFKETLEKYGFNDADVKNFKISMVGTVKEIQLIEPFETDIYNRVLKHKRGDIDEFLKQKFGYNIPIEHNNNLCSARVKMNIVLKTNFDENLKRLMAVNIDRFLNLDRKPISITFKN